MTPKNNDTRNSAESLQEPRSLRHRALEKLNGPALLAVDEPDSDDNGTIIHELQVHQIELEMQNEELRQSQETLHLSQERYVELYDFAPIGYVTVSEEGIILEANLTATKLTGVNRCDLIGTSFCRGILPDFQDVYYMYRKSLLESGGPKTCELMMHQKGDDDIWVRLEANTTTDGENETVIRMVMSDITEQKSVEEKLQHSNEFNESLLQTIPFPMSIVDDQGRILFVTPLMERINGKALTGQCYCWTQFRDRNTQCDNCPLRNPIEIGQTARVEAEGMLGGRTFDIFHTGILYHGKKALLEVFVDISDRKEAEAHRKLLQDQLAQSQKMESIGRLAGGVAHDFNNLLGVIIGRLEIAIDMLNYEGEVAEEIRGAQHAAERSAALTRQLMGFARKQPMSPTVLDLSEAVDGMLPILHRLIGESVKLVWTPNPDVWKIMMDPSQVDQIFTNLCVNARDAIEDVGQITIEIENLILDDAFCRLATDLSPGEYVCISVSDDGCGMAKETLANVFEPFFTTKSKDKGTGLGLSTTYGIIRQNRGAIEVLSELGRGTTFKVYLPSYIGEHVEEKKAQPENLPGGGGETILLVEDNPVLLILFETMLKKLEYTVLVASSPEEALTIAKNQPDSIRLLLTDIIMPGMNGPELADELHLINPAIDYLFISGYTDDLRGRYGLLDESTNFLQKPFTQASLNAKIRSILDHGGPVT